MQPTGINLDEAVPGDTVVQINKRLGKPEILIIAAATKVFRKMQAHTEVAGLLGPLDCMAFAAP